MARLRRSGALTREQAERALAICNNYGPAFLVGAAGVGVFHSAGYGLLLYGVHVLSAVIVGMLFAPRSGGFLPEDRSQIAAVSLSQALPEAVRSAVRAVLTVSGFVVTFSVMTGVLDASGLLPALVCMYRQRCSRGFAVTLAILPAMVQMVILLVNGNIGAGVAVAGAFSLVRFRSVPGTAREIGAIFLAMAIGLATGMGYVALAAIFFVIVAAALLALTAMSFGDRSPRERLLKITIPENLDYDGLFDDIFRQYTSSHTLERVKTTNMGTLYELQYHITLKVAQVPKVCLDALRCRNGNLNILCSREMQKETL